MRKIKFLNQKHSQKRTDREKAQAMVVSFIYVSVVALIAVYMMNYAKNVQNIVVREIKHSMSFYAGEAALIRAYTALHTGGPSPVGVEVGAPMTVRTDPPLSFGDGVQRISVFVDWY